MIDPVTRWFEQAQVYKNRQFIVVSKSLTTHGLPVILDQEKLNTIMKENSKQSLINYVQIWD